MDAIEAAHDEREGEIVADWTIGHSTSPTLLRTVKEDMLHGMRVTPDALELAWKGVLKALESGVQEIISQGGNIIPRISYGDIEAGLSDSQKDAIRKRGVVIITRGIPKEEALEWKQQLKDYIVANPVKGWPADNIQAYGLYHSKTQLYARTHDSVLSTQKMLLSFWHSSTPFPASIDFTTPISYFDRLRIRTPGDRTFAFGSHIDWGGFGRWEDTTTRRMWTRIFCGGENGWETFDPFDATWRVDAKQELDHSACSVLRCWQGWTSLSSTGINEGTLRVLPMLSLTTAYIILRPFFRPRSISTAAGTTGTPGKTQGVSLAAEDWELNLEDSEFPGSAYGTTLGLNEDTHPHLRLGETMVSIPRVEPGDQVYWHQDIVHDVESEHKGKQDSSVLYIPAVPLSIQHAWYLRRQRDNFIRGFPPDSSGGEGESGFLDRGTPEDITSYRGRQATGLEPFVATDACNAALVEEANKILFG